MTIDTQALDRLREIVGGSAADLAELVESFLEEAPATMDSLLEAVQRTDINGVRRAAHTIKSNARDMGALTLAEINAEIETLCANGALPGPDKVQGARQALDEAVAELRRYLETEPGQ